MKQEKQFDPAGINDESPAPGMAAVNTHNPEEGERTKGKGERDLKETDSDISQDPNRFNAPDKSVAAELNIRSGSPATSGEAKSVEQDVTPRNLEADSDGA